MRIPALFLLPFVSLISSCSMTSFYVVRPDNASAFHTSELCLYLYSPSEVAGWSSVPEENQIMSAELTYRGFSTRESCSAFEYGRKECSKKNLGEELNRVCIKQYAEDFNAKRLEVIDRYARQQAALQAKQQGALDGMRKNIEDMQKLQDKWNPYRKPF